MAIKANNVVNLSKQGAAVSSPSNVDEPVKTQQRKNSGIAVIRKPSNPTASNEAVLVVNGKEKNIGRKSHYLLDMLTLDD